jgi:hypothetical protein
MPLEPEVEKLALELWREREMRFPAYARRMVPDDMDRATCAWEGMVQRAERMTMGGAVPQTVLKFEGRPNA